MSRWSKSKKSKVKKHTRRNFRYHSPILEWIVHSNIIVWTPEINNRMNNNPIKYQVNCLTRQFPEKEILWILSQIIENQADLLRKTQNYSEIPFLTYHIARQQSIFNNTLCWWVSEEICSFIHWEELCKLVKSSIEENLTISLSFIFEPEIALREP